LIQWDGTFHAPLNSFKRYETTLRKAQQAVSRKTKLSHNWAKACVQCIHQTCARNPILPIARRPQGAPVLTSRTCPACKHVSADSRQTQARFACVECDFEENADLVGAINVLRAGARPVRL